MLSLDFVALMKIKMSAAGSHPREEIEGKKLNSNEFLEQAPFVPSALRDWMSEHRPLRSHPASHTCISRCWFGTDTRWMIRKIT